MSDTDSEFRFLAYVAIGTVGGCIHYAVSPTAILPKSIFFGIVLCLGFLGSLDVYRRFLIRDRARQIEVWRKGYANQAPVASDSVYYIATSIQYIVPLACTAGVVLYCWHEAKAEELTKFDSLLLIAIYACIAAAIALPAGMLLHEMITQKSKKLKGDR